jgi:hypothetical protein
MRVRRAQSKKFLSSLCATFRDTTLGASTPKDRTAKIRDRATIVSASGGCFAPLNTDRRPAFCPSTAEKDEHVFERQSSISGILGVI